MAPVPPPPPPPIVIFTLAFSRRVSKLSVRSALVASIPSLSPAQILSLEMSTLPPLARRLSELINLGSSPPLTSTYDVPSNDTAASGTAADVRLETSPVLSDTNLLLIVNSSTFLDLMSANLGVAVSFASEAQLHIHSSSLAFSSTTVVALESTTALVVIAVVVLCFCGWYQWRWRLANSLLSKGVGWRDHTFDSAAIGDRTSEGGGQGESGLRSKESPSPRKRVKEALQKRGFAPKRVQIMPVGTQPTDQSMAEGETDTGKCGESTGDAAASSANATRARCASVYARGRRRLSSVAVAPLSDERAGATSSPSSSASVDESGLEAQRGSTKSFKLGFREALMRNSAIGSKAPGSSNLLGSHAGRSDDGSAFLSAKPGTVQTARSNGAILRARKAMASWSGGRASKARLTGGGDGDADRTTQADDRVSKATASSEEALRETRRDGAHGVGGGFSVTRL